MVDSRILLLRGVYFFSTTSASSIVRFLIVYLNQYFSADQLGLLIGVRKILSFFSAFFWGFIADCLDKRLLILIFGAVSSVILTNGLIFQIIYSSFWYTFGLLCVVTFLGSTTSLLDAIILQILINKDGSKAYGPSRMWGAIGWGIGAVICGSLVTYLGNNFLFWFYDSCQLIVLSQLICCFPCALKNAAEAKITILINDRSNDIDSETNNKMIKEKMYYEPMQSPINEIIAESKNNRIKNDDSDNATKSMFWDFLVNTMSIGGFMFYLNLIIFGISMCFVEQFLFVFLTDYFNATEFLCGLTLVFMIAGEAPMFGYSKLFLDKIGLIGLLTISHIAYIVRVFIYTILPQEKDKAWYILFVEPLHGLTFAGMWMASVEYGSKFAPPNLQGTMQGLISGLYGGFAASIGAILGGWLYNTYGPVFMYRLSGTVVFGWTIIFNIILRCGKCINPKSKSIKILFDEELNNKDNDDEYPALSIKNINKRNDILSESIDEDSSNN